MPKETKQIILKMEGEWKGNNVKVEFQFHGALGTTYKRPFSCLFYYDLVHSCTFGVYSMETPFLLVFFHRPGKCNVGHG